MPRSARWLVGLAGATGCVAALGAALAVGAPHLAVARLRAAAGAPLEVGSASFDWSRRRVVLADLRLPGAAGAAPLRIRRLTVPLDVRWLWQSAPRFVGVEVEGARLVVHRDARGEFSLAPPARPTPLGAGRPVAKPASAATGSAASSAAALRLRGAVLRATQLAVIDDASGERSIVRVPALRVVGLDAARSAEGDSLRLRARQDGGAVHDLDARWRSSAAHQHLAVRLRATRLSLRGIGAALGHAELRSGKLRGVVSYRRRSAGGAPAERVTADAELAHLQLASRDAGEALSLARLVVRGLHLDAQRATLRCADLRARGGRLRLAASRLTPAPAAAPGSGTGGWRTQLGRLEVRRLAVLIAGLETAPSFELRFAAARGLTPATPPALRARLAFPNGGSARLRTLKTYGEPELRALARLDRVPLAGLPGVANEPLRLASGTVSGWAVLLADGPSIAEAKISLDDVRIDGRTPEGRLALAGAGRIVAAIDRSSLRPIRLRLREATLSAPRLLIMRTKDGVLPFTLLTELVESPLLRPWFESRPSAARDAPAASQEAPPDVPLLVRLRDGSVELDDRLVRPPVALDLRDVSGELRQSAAPARSLTAELSGALEPDASFTLGGAIDGAQRTLRLTVADLDAALLSTYLRALIGHTATGRASLALDWASEPGWTTAAASVATSALELTQVRDVNPYDDALRAPLRRVVELAQRAPGELDLELAFARPIDAEESLRAAIAGALREAIAEQLLARLAGGATGREPHLARRRLAAVVFPPGKDALSDASPLELERLALLLRLQPEARVTVEGRAGRRDGNLKPAQRAALGRARADWVVQQLLALAPAARDRVASAAPVDAADGGVVLEVELFPTGGATADPSAGGAAAQPGEASAPRG